MSTYIVDINSYTAGQNLIGSGWSNPITRAGTTLTAQGTSPNKVIRIFGNVTGTKLFGYDAVQSVNDVEILVKFRLSSDFGKQGVAALRYTGNSEATTKGYQASGSFISSAGTLAIDEGSTGYTAWSAWNYLANVTYWVRFRVNGANQYAKVWIDGNAEPGSWTTTSTNSVQTAGTYNGLATYSIASGGASSTIDYYYVSFGTNGDQAPSTQTSKTQVGNVRITATTDKTQSGNVRITQTVDKTQSGNVRVTAQTSRTQLGNVRIVAGIDYNVKPVGSIAPEIPKVGSYTIKPTGTADKSTRLVASEQIRPVLHIDEYTTSYTDTTVLTDDLFALCDDPFALTGSLISIGERPDALRAVVDKGNISINKEQIKWQTTQQTTPALQTSTDKPLWPQTTTQPGIIKSTQKSSPSVNV